MEGIYSTNYAPEVRFFLCQKKFCLQTEGDSKQDKAVRLYDVLWDFPSKFSHVAGKKL